MDISESFAILLSRQKGMSPAEVYTWVEHRVRSNTGREEYIPTIAARTYERLQVIAPSTLINGSGEC